MSKQIHTFLLPVEDSFRTNRGPAKSTPVLVKAGSSLILNSGRGGGGGPSNGAPSLADCTSVDDSSDKAPALHDPVLYLNFCSSVVANTLMSIVNYDGSEVVPSGQQNRVLSCEWDIGIL